jgi:hypothetical protein
MSAGIVTSPKWPKTQAPQISSEKPGAAAEGKLTNPYLYNDANVGGGAGLSLEQAGQAMQMIHIVLAIFLHPPKVQFNPPHSKEADQICNGRERPKHKDEFPETKLKKLPQFQGWWNDV